MPLKGSDKKNDNSFTNINKFDRIYAGEENGEV